MLTSAVRFASQVGVAPSTTTIALDGAALGIQCMPEPGPLVMPGGGDGASGNTSGEIMSPYAIEADLKGRGFGLAFPTDAWRTGRSYGRPGTMVINTAGGGSFAGAGRRRARGRSRGFGLAFPTDAWRTGRSYGRPGTMVINTAGGGSFAGAPCGVSGGLGIAVNEIQRSLSGPSYAKCLGAIPTDFELASSLCHLPVESGWIYGKDQYGNDVVIPGGNPPLGDITTDGSGTFWLQVISTLAVVGVATAAWMTYAKNRKQSR